MSAGGAIILREEIDIITYLESALTVVAGIYVWIRKRHLQTGNLRTQNDLSVVFRTETAYSGTRMAVF